MFFQDGLEVLEDGSTDDLIDAYVAPENYAQEGTPVREGKGGFTAVANGSTLFSSKYTRLGWNADTQVYSWNNAGNDVISGMKQGNIFLNPFITAGLVQFLNHQIDTLPHNGLDIIFRRIDKLTQSQILFNHLIDTQILHLINVSGQNSLEQIERIDIHR